MLLRDSGRKLFLRRFALHPLSTKISTHELTYFFLFLIVVFSNLTHHLWKTFHTLFTFISRPFNQKRRFPTRLFSSPFLNLDKPRLKKDIVHPSFSYVLFLARWMYVLWNWLLEFLPDDFSLLNKVLPVFAIQLLNSHRLRNSDSHTIPLPNNFNNFI